MSGMQVAVQNPGTVQVLQGVEQAVRRCTVSSASCTRREGPRTGMSRITRKRPVIVIIAPLFDQHLRLAQGHEQFLAQQFVPTRPLHSPPELAYAGCTSPEVGAEGFWGR
jgi:hypothetical protein